MNNLKNITTIFAFLFFTAGVYAATEPKQVIGCPNYNVTLLKGKTHEDVCVRLYDDLTGKPTKAKLWWKTNGGANIDLGWVDEKVCIEFDRRSPTFELRAGHIPSSMSFFIFRGTSMGKYPGFVWNKSRSQRDADSAIDPCKPACKQLPAPTDTLTWNGSSCSYICEPKNDRFGEWEHFCAGSVFDPISGRLVPAN